MIISLMYHDVYSTSPSESGLASDLYKIKIEEFEEQIIRLKKIEEKTPGSIILTFDDGGSSFYTPISHILDKYNLKGYFFVATKYINSPGFLTDEQIVNLDKRGHVVGSHSHSHPENLSTFSIEEIQNEGSSSLSILERILKHKVTVASIPNGYQSKNVLESARIANITTLFTSKPTIKEVNYKGMKLIGRYVVLNDMSTDEVLSFVFSRKKRALLWGKWLTLNVVKLFLGNKYEIVKQKVFK